jgi:glycerate kinase
LPDRQRPDVAPAARRALAAPASLKGVLSAAEAATALAVGFAAVGVEADELPIADGGEGTAAVLAAALGGAWREAKVSDPLGRPVDARWLELPEGTAVIESAEAIGLGRVRRGELDPLRASSRGLGELIVAASRARSRTLLVCLGGSATVDGGAGVREVLEKLPLQTTALHDVRTTLADAARLYGPQKGATADEVTILERRLAAMDELRPYADLPGAGAAGGLGAAFAALGAELVPGASYVLDRIGFRLAARRAALVVTGEGVVDETTAEGKASAAALQACLEEGIRCAVFGGRVKAALPGAELHELSGRPERAADDLTALGERLGRELVQ